MPWRLLVVIIAFAILVVFIMFNLDNKCDVSFGFTKFESVPVFLSIFISFLLGLLCTLPIALHTKIKQKKPPMADIKPETINPNPVDGGPHVD